MKRILKYWPLLLVIGLSLVVTWPLFLPGYFAHHDDLQVMRIFEMRKCFADLQIPCRWVPDMGYGNGYPLFNYYNVFPYYLGGVVSFILGFINSAKFLFFVSLVLAPISMFILARKLLGVYPAILASILYGFAPYRALDIYVRGAIAESFAIAIVPLIFYFGYCLLKQYSLKNFLGLSLSLAAFLTSHNIMTLIFSPLIAVIFVIWVWREKFSSFKLVSLSVLLGVGLSAFFILPAFLEKDLVQIDNLVKLDLDFRAHFATLPQLFFDRTWGYGASSPGTDDTISFQIGIVHWILALLSIPTLFILRKNIKLMLTFLVVLSFFVISIFMTHNKSAFVWEAIGLLRFTQFPWRFLSVTIFTSSLLGGFLIYALKGSLQKIAVLILVAVVFILNWNYFKPGEFYFDLTDQQKLSGNLWETQQKAAMLDYLPMGAIEPREASSGQPMIRAGQVEVEYFKNKSNSWELKVDVAQKASIEFPVYDFPNWTVYDGGKEIPHSKDTYLGRITISLEPGAHHIMGKLNNTATRNIANLITLISFVVLVYLLMYAKVKQSLKKVLNKIYGK